MAKQQGIAVNSATGEPILNVKLRAIEPLGEKRNNYRGRRINKRRIQAAIDNINWKLKQNSFWDGKFYNDPSNENKHQRRTNSNWFGTTFSSFQESKGFWDNKSLASQQGGMVAYNISQFIARNTQNARGDGGRDSKGNLIVDPSTNNFTNLYKKYRTAAGIYGKNPPQLRLQYLTYQTGIDFLNSNSNEESLRKRWNRSNDEWYNKVINIKGNIPYPEKLWSDYFSLYWDNSQILNNIPSNLSPSKLILPSFGATYLNGGEAGFAIPSLNLPNGNTLNNVGFIGDKYISSINQPQYYRDGSPENGGIGPNYGTGKDRAFMVFRSVRPYKMINPNTEFDNRQQAVMEVFTRLMKIFRYYFGELAVNQLQSKPINTTGNSYINQWDGPNVDIIYLAKEIALSQTFGIITRRSKEEAENEKDPAKLELRKIYNEDFAISQGVQGLQDFKATTFTPS